MGLHSVYEAVGAFECGDTMTMQQIRDQRGVPAKRGMRVFYRHAERYGTITSARNGYLRILLDGESYPWAFHPTWEIDYLDNDGNVILRT